MQMIGRHDHSHVDKIRARSFCRCHRLKGRIGAIFVQREGCARLAAQRGIGRKSTRHDLESIAHPHGRPVIFGEKRASAAADHADSKTFTARNVKCEWTHSNRLVCRDLKGTCQIRPRMWSEAFSPIMIAAAFVLPEQRWGITDASATRRPGTPRTRKSG